MTVVQDRAAIAMGKWADEQDKARRFHDIGDEAGERLCLDQAKVYSHLAIYLFNVTPEFRCD